MSISLLSTFAGDGEQSDVTVEKINEIITALNAAGEGGGGGGGFPFPMAEGVWYDQTYAIPGISGQPVALGADYLAGGFILIPFDCTITKVGILPDSAPGSEASVLVGIYALDANGFPAAQVGSTATVVVADTWNDIIEEAATSIEVTAGWYFVCVACGVELEVQAVQVANELVGRATDVDSSNLFSGYYAETTDIHLALPATFVGNEDLERSNDPMPRIFFQITHAT